MKEDFVRKQHDLLQTFGRRTIELLRTGMWFNGERMVTPEDVGSLQAWLIAEMMDASNSLLSSGVDVPYFFEPFDHRFAAADALEEWLKDTEEVVEQHLDPVDERIKRLFTPVTEESRSMVEPTANRREFFVHSFLVFLSVIERIAVPLFRGPDSPE